MADEDDPFESLLFLEERCQKDGYTEGWAAGVEKGLSAGHKLGTEKGKELGSEIGFYSGFVKTWLILVDKCEKKNPRVISLLKNLQVLINQLPLNDPTNESLFTDVEKLRAKFKQVSKQFQHQP
ncbi:hypothetical protein QZH41_008900 [Actinostola sp. cb2023]|nr:hypothetical protein QZH41_008900 [Actinostola sp. cb2023]